MQRLSFANKFVASSPIGACAGRRLLVDLACGETQEELLN